MCVTFLHRCLICSVCICTCPLQSLSGSLATLSVGDYVCLLVSCTGIVLNVYYIREYPFTADPVQAL